MPQPETKPAMNEAPATVERIVAKMGELPMIPTIALKALEMSEDPQVSINELQVTLTQDQALTAQIRANADRYFGPGQAVTVRVVDAIPRTAAGKLKNSVIDPDDSVPTSAP